MIGRIPEVEWGKAVDFNLLGWFAITSLIAKKSG